MVAHSKCSDFIDAALLRAEPVPVRQQPELKKIDILLVRKLLRDLERAGVKGADDL
jgi:hypothetical protein